MPAATRVAAVYADLSARVVNFRRGMAQAAGSVAGLTGAFDRFRASMVASAVATAAYAAGIGAIYAAFRGADSIINFENQIREATGVLTGHALTVTQVRDVYQRLVDVAQDTRSSLQGTVTIFARVAQAGQGISAGLDTILQFTESLNQAVILGGATAAEAQNALIQLSQGLASGTLRGDELRSVLEQLPVVADVIARSLGVTRGELRELGEEGKITADIIVDAFRKAEEDLSTRFARVNLTLSQALTTLRNATTDLFGRFASDSGAVQVISRAIIALAENIELLARAAVGAVAAMVALTSIRIIAGIGKLVASLALLFVTNPIGGFFAAIGTGLSLLVRSIGIAIGYFVAFGDEIKIFENGLASVHDLISFTFDRLSAALREVAGETSGIANIGKAFTDAGAVADGVIGDLIYGGARLLAWYDVIADQLTRLFTDNALFRGLNALREGVIGFGNELGILARRVIELTGITALWDSENEDGALTFEEALGRRLAQVEAFREALEADVLADWDITPLEETLQSTDRLIFRFKELSGIIASQIDFGAAFAGNIAELQKLAPALDSLASGALMRFETALVNVFRTGQLAAGEFLDALAGDILQQLIRSTITVQLAEGLKSAFQGAFSGLAGGVGLTASLTAAGTALSTQMISGAASASTALTGAAVGVASEIVAGATAAGAALVSAATAAASILGAGAGGIAGSLTLAHSGGVVGRIRESRSLGKPLRSDEIHAILQRGEVVVPNSMRNRPSHEIANWIKSLPRYHSGGVAGSSPITGTPAGSAQGQNVQFELINSGAPKDVVNSSARVTAHGVVYTAMLEDSRRGGGISKLIRSMR